jgi:peptidoglycan/LPS O-acetylase OafA/YrhL
MLLPRGRGLPIIASVAQGLSDGAAGARLEYKHDGQNRILLRRTPPPTVESPDGRNRVQTGVIAMRQARAGGDLQPVELAGLTSLRGLAALAVLLFHVSFLSYRFADGGPPVLWRRGYLAVDLFFFLSGFILTHVYGDRLAADRSRRGVGSFLWARFCRLYPMNVFTLAVLAAQYLLGRLDVPAGFSFKTQLTASLLLMQVPWLREVALNSPSWSISAEFYAYLVFPLVVPVVARLRGRTASALGTALLIGIAVNHLLFSHEAEFSGWGALSRALSEFIAGIFIYRFYRERRLRRIWAADVTFIAIAAMIVTLCAAGASDGPIVSLLPALVLAAAANTGRVDKILGAGPLRRLGEISYSLYIFQAVPLMFAVRIAGPLTAHGLGGWRFGAIAALLAIGSAGLVHRCIDAPARAALRRLPDRLAASIAVRRVAEASMPAEVYPQVAPPGSGR